MLWPSCPLTVMIEVERKEEKMKKCHRCGTPWLGYGAQPREREVCEGCGKTLHCCNNCHHFDHELSRQCTLDGTFWEGSREAQNYCEGFAMTDSVRKEAEKKVSKAENAFHSLWEK